MNIPKYRAWHKWLKKMYEVLSIDFEHKMISCPCQDDCETDVDGFDFAEIELMQFTRLTDSTGQDIYAGDVVVSDLVYGRRLWEVFWRAEWPGFYLRALHAENEWIEPLHVKSNNIGPYRVIGNIYQQPELLEVQS